MPKITYEENGNVAYFNGLKYRRDKRTGYYLHTVSHGRTGSRLHRDVYEHYNGKIPEGYHVHHKDHDKSNNEIENLEMLKSKEHQVLHGAELTDEQREWKRNNLISNAVPAAREYNLKHRDREYYLRLYEKSKDKLYEKRNFVCEMCGKKFESSQVKSRFCSNACKSAWRRKSGLDDVERKCPVCGNKFTVNKYSKTVCCSKGCANTFRSISVG